jgi:hypothetical protein
MEAKQPPSKGKRRKKNIYEKKKEKKGTKMMKI